MTDGLYQVETAKFCAGFVIKDGQVIKCAPILRKNIEKWKKVAVRISYFGPPGTVPWLDTPPEKEWPQWLDTE